MMTCPTSGALVPTGHRTFDLDLATMTAPRSFRCTACKEVHTWSAKEATVEKTPKLAASASPLECAAE
jgi:hypothetical protein